MRYDGNHRYDNLVVNSLTDSFQLIGICPEVEIGLGIPRAPIQLKQVKNQIKLVAVDNPDQDYTEAMINFSQYCLEHYAFSGLVLKDRSPSCALGNAAIINEHKQPDSYGHGLFTQTFVTARPDLPIISAEQLQQPSAVDHFIAQVKLFAATHNPS